MLERLEIEAFLTLVDELHFGRTAERLQVTTSRVSQTIKKLERLAGAPLFERTSRTVAVTPLGARLADDLRPAYQQVEAVWARTVAEGRGAVTVLRVGFLSAGAGQLVARAAELFARRNPGHRAELREVQAVDAVARLRDGQLDVLVLPLPLDEPDVVTGPVVLTDARVLAVPADHPLARRVSATLEDLAEIPALQLPDATPVHWRSDRTPRRTPGGRPVMAGPSFSTVQEALALIGAGSGALVLGAQMRRFYARDDVVYLPLRGTPPLEWVPAWVSGRGGPAVDRFVEAVRGSTDRPGDAPQAPPVTATP
ncbi:LysR family transcriptional regulator [Krasilnikoviella flava]|uniref:DNA-binding transcriptional regulator, LysR family n=1 Tax=Krasilnikoviella flava TaxID=526729 RepID=A0A1T5JNQ2_9MICO|nr:LysR family transcriptional regulator [Krasilnikoviella flava]SKC53051.1 DNA-binding transcriptional regulator, LysR family [Krasilnikoviella flava]